MFLWLSRPPELGVREGRLTNCPSSPNCVSSQATDSTHAMAPLPMQGSADAALERLATIVTSLPRTRITHRSERYLRAEFTTPWMRFVDDVEFLVDETAGVVHFRSASRVGHSDWGVNRKRMEEISRRYRGEGRSRGAPDRDG